MMKKLGAWGLAAAMTLMSGGAMADLAGGPPGSGGEGGSGGSGGSGGGDKKDDGGGCSAATPGTASRSAAIAVGLGLLLVIPAARKRGARKAKK